MKKYFAFIIFVLILKPPLFANDSIATVSAGGITLQKTDGIVMQSEDLYLSLDQVKVHYVFENVSGQDIKTTVAFPLPPLNSEDSQLSVDPNSKNPLHFEIRVNGKRVEFNEDRKSIPNAQVKLTYYWEQLFPKGQKIEVYHVYKPGIGTYLLNPGMDPSGKQSSEKTYCIDPALKKWIENNSKKTSGISPIKELIYILSTGSHWKGPIRDFRLVVDKGNPDRRVAFCMDDIRKITATQFEVRKKNFTPIHDIRIAFFEPYREIK